MELPTGLFIGNPKQLLSTKYAVDSLKKRALIVSGRFKFSKYTAGLTSPNKLDIYLNVYPDFPYNFREKTSHSLL